MYLERPSFVGFDVSPEIQEGAEPIEDRDSDLLDETPEGASEPELVSEEEQTRTLVEGAAQEKLGGEPDNWSWGAFSKYKAYEIRDGQLFDLETGISLTKQFEEFGDTEDHHLMLSLLDGNPGQTYTLAERVEGSFTFVTVAVVHEGNLVSFLERVYTEPLDSGEETIDENEVEDEELEELEDVLIELLEEQEPTEPGQEEVLIVPSVQNESLVREEVLAAEDAITKEAEQTGTLVYEHPEISSRTSSAVSSEIVEPSPPEEDIAVSAQELLQETPQKAAQETRQFSDPIPEEHAPEIQIIDSKFQDLIVAKPKVKTEVPVAEKILEKATKANAKEKVRLEIANEEPPPQKEEQVHIPEVKPHVAPSIKEKLETKAKAVEAPPSRKAANDNEGVINEIQTPKKETKPKTEEQNAKPSVGEPVSGVSSEQTQRSITESLRVLFDEKGAPNRETVSNDNEIGPGDVEASKAGVEHSLFSELTPEFARMMGIVPFSSPRKGFVLSADDTGSLPERTASKSGITLRRVA